MQIAASVELPDREAHFVGALANGRAPKRAAKEAGYAVGSPRILLAKEYIRAALRAPSAVLRDLLDQS